MSSTKSLFAQRNPNTPTAGQSASRFAKPASVSSSALFAKSPSVRRPEDEIETGVEEPSSSSPPLPTRFRFSPRPRDSIDDDIDGDEVLDASRPEKVAQDDEDDLSDLFSLERSRDTTTRRQSEHEYDVHRTEATPRKRQRTSEADTAMDNVITVSSSPSPEQHHTRHVSDNEDFPTGFSHIEPPAEHTDEDFTSSPTGPSSALVNSRFRIPTPAVFPMPTASTRPSFKLPQGPSAGTSGQSASSALPDAFSPSRRHGRKEYQPGGAADTVRSWVLALAAEESKAGQTYTERFRVVEMRNDSCEGRCELVKDEHGRKWLLINGSANVGGLGSNSVSRTLTIGCSVGIKASSTSRNLQLNLRDQLETDGRSDVEKMAGEWSIGIMWDVLE